MEKKTINGSMIVIPVISALVLLGIFVWYRNTTNVFERLLIVTMFFVCIMPAGLTAFKFLLSVGIKTTVATSNTKKIHSKPNQESKSNSKVKQNQAGQSNAKPQYKKAKENTNLHYQELRNCIIACSKNKIFDRDNIFTLKSEIDYCLGNHRFVYDNNMKFENDLNEIYVKIKSSKLTDDNYLHLLQVVSGIVEKNTEGREVV